MEPNKNGDSFADDVNIDLRDLRYISDIRTDTDVLQVLDGTAAMLVAGTLDCRAAVAIGRWPLLQRMQNITRHPNGAIRQSAARYVRKQEHLKNLNLLSDDKDISNRVYVAGRFDPGWSRYLLLSSGDRHRLSLHESMLEYLRRPDNNTVFQHQFMSTPYKTPSPFESLYRARIDRERMAYERERIEVQRNISFRVEGTAVRLMSRIPPAHIVRTNPDGED
jgi:hypothetical protein